MEGRNLCLRPRTPLFVEELQDSGGRLVLEYPLSQEKFFNRNVPRTFVR